MSCFYGGYILPYPSTKWGHFVPGRSVLPLPSTEAGVFVLWVGVLGAFRQYCPLPSTEAGVFVLKGGFCRAVGGIKGGRAGV